MRGVDETKWDTESDSASSVLPAAHSGNADLRSTGAAHILVVEDEPTVASLIADVLRENKRCVDLLPGAERALEAAARDPYDLAICDMRMPGMDGQLFYEALVQTQNPLRDHILFVTGHRIALRNSWSGIICRRWPNPSGSKS